MDSFVFLQQWSLYLTTPSSPSILSISLSRANIRRRSATPPNVNHTKTTPAATNCTPTYYFQNRAQLASATSWVRL